MVIFIAIFKPSNFYPNLQEIDLEQDNIFSCQVNTNGSTIKAYRIKILYDNNEVDYTYESFTITTGSIIPWAINDVTTNIVRFSTNHNFGTIGDFVNIQYVLKSDGATTIGGLTIGSTYRVKIIDSKKVQFQSSNTGGTPGVLFGARLTSVGTGTHFFKFEPSNNLITPIKNKGFLDIPVYAGIIPNGNGKDYKWSLRTYEKELCSTTQPETLVCSGFLVGSTKNVIWTGNNGKIVKDRWVEFKTTDIQPSATDFSNVDIDNNIITISAHGFGTNGDFIYIKYLSTTGSPIHGLTLGNVYLVKITGENTIEFMTSGVGTDLISVGTGTHTFVHMHVMDKLPTQDITLPSAGVEYRERHQIIWVDKDLGNNKDVTKIEVDKPFKYSYVNDTVFNVFQVSDAYTDLSVFVDPSDAIIIGKYIVVSGRTHDGVRRKIIGYTPTTGEIRVQVPFNIIPINGDLFAVFDIAAGGSQLYPATSGTLPIGGTAITDATFKVKTNTPTQLFIQPNINIKSDKTNPDEIVFKNADRVDIKNNITTVDYKEVDKTIDKLDNSQWLITTDDLTHPIIPQTDYSIYTDFIDSSPECSFWARKTPTLTMQYKNYGSDEGFVDVFSVNSDPIIIDGGANFDFYIKIVTADWEYSRLPPIDSVVSLYDINDNLITTTIAGSHAPTNLIIKSATFKQYSTGQKLLLTLYPHQLNNNALEDMTNKLNTASYFIVKDINYSLVRSYRDVVFNTLWDYPNNTQIKNYQYFLNDTNGNIIKQSEKIYSNDTEWIFRGLESGTIDNPKKYTIKINIEDEYGKIFYKENDFYIYYLVETPDIPMAVTQLCDKNAFKVDFVIPTFVESIDYGNKETVTSNNLELTSQVVTIPDNKVLNYGNVLDAITPTDIIIPQIFSMVSNFQINGAFLDNIENGSETSVCKVTHEYDSGFDSYDLRLSSFDYFNIGTSMTINSQRFELKLYKNNSSTALTCFGINDYFNINTSLSTTREFTTPTNFYFCLQSISSTDFKVGKNLIDLNTMVTGKFISAGGLNIGDLSDSTSYKATDFIPVLPNTTYRYRNGTNTPYSGITRLAFYNVSKVYIGGTVKVFDDNDADRTMTTTSGTYYIRISDSISRSQLQLELGSDSTYYEVYITSSILSYKSQLPTIPTTVEKSKKFIVNQETGANIGNNGIYYWDTILEEWAFDTRTLYLWIENTSDVPGTPTYGQLKVPPNCRVPANSADSATGVINWVEDGNIWVDNYDYNNINKDILNNKWFTMYLRVNNTNQTKPVECLIEIKDERG